MGSWKPPWAASTAGKEMVVAMVEKEMVAGTGVEAPMVACSEFTLAKFL